MQIKINSLIYKAISHSCTSMHRTGKKIIPGNGIEKANIAVHKLSENDQTMLRVFEENEWEVFYILVNDKNKIIKIGALPLELTRPDAIECAKAEILEEINVPKIRGEFRGYTTDDTGPPAIMRIAYLNGYFDGDLVQFS